MAAPAVRPVAEARDQRAVRTPAHLAASARMPPPPRSGLLRPLPPAVAASPLASRPYDLRHSALSTWLNAGVDPTEVAERADNSVEVLLTRYAKCLDGRQDVANRRIEDLLREYE
jgi:hypothetical protein